ncbi:MAG TPA: DinB family protein [Cyclobacteriaceae bacterium]|nr:DinB family protein [Cyclobacteriaceae bacterium]
MVINKNIESLISRIETQREWVGDYIGNFNSDQLNTSPGPGRWSALEVIRHIYLSEKLTLDYLRKKWSFSPQLKPAGILTWLRYQALIVSMRQPVIRLKAPAIARVERKNLDPRLMMNDWQAMRKELLDFIAGLPEDVLKKEFYKHPIAGKMRLDHMLKFFYHHTERHIRQIKRIGI